MIGQELIQSNPTSRHQNQKDNITVQGGVDKLVESEQGAYSALQMILLYFSCKSNKCIFFNLKE